MAGGACSWGCMVGGAGGRRGGSRRRDNSIPIPLRRLAIGVYTKYDTVVLRGRRKVKALKDRGRGGLKQGQEAKDAGKGAGGTTAEAEEADNPMAQGAVERIALSRMGRLQMCSARMDW